VANKTVDSEQLTVCWLVDNLKASHENPEVVDDFIEWVRKQYGEIGELKVTRRTGHEYLGMILDYTVPGQVSVDMTRYVGNMLQEHPSKCLSGSRVASPWNENLFSRQR
jgi:hypothetical protein